MGSSAPFDNIMGVMQGCSLPATLFGLYIDHLEHQVQSHVQNDSEVLDTNFLTLLYADDIVLLSQLQLGPQQRLNVLQYFCVEFLFIQHVPKQFILFVFSAIPTAVTSAAPNC